MRGKGKDGAGALGWGRTERRRPHGGAGIIFGGGLVAKLYPTLCNPMDYSPPGSSVPGILQARILEWVAIPFSRGSLQTHAH